MHYGHSKQIRKSTGLGISGMIKVNKVSAVMTALLSGMYTLLNMKHMSHVYVCILPVLLGPVSALDQEQDHTGPIRTSPKWSGPGPINNRP